MNPLRKNDAFASYTETIITSIILSVIIFTAVVNQPEAPVVQPIAVPQNNVTIDVESFNFHVHCPLRNRTDAGFLELMKHLKINDSATIDKIEAQLSTIDTYAVFQRVFTVDPANSSSEMLMSYCGWAKLLNEIDCNSARFVCTIPGPMFRVAVGTEISVVWVNQINGPDFDWSFDENNCYDQSNVNSYCWQMAKKTPDQSCTFVSPSDIDPTLTKTVRIAPTAAPVSPHVHGIQNRPTFDGNPYSWFNNAGDKGIGYFSASTNDYFTLFNRSFTFWAGLLSPSQQASIKVNRYINAQPPGFFFYHDHAMRTTLFHNMKGSVGFYILYDDSVQGTLPQAGEEVIFILHFHNEGDIRDYGNGSFSSVTGEGYIPPTGDTLFVSKTSAVYRNMTYRFRFINGHFDDFYTNISFAVFYKTESTNGLLILTQVEPPYNSNDNNVIMENMHLLNFTVIGTDGALFRTPIHNLSLFSLMAAERLQLLIKFDRIPASVGYVYVVCYDANDDMPFVVKYVYKVSNQAVANKYPNPSQYTFINTPFTDLRSIPNATIAQYRMRPLFSRPTEVTFSINLHPIFQKAASENPKIGTIQDWFIINTAQESHPIHIHLVNFQVLQELSLKTTPEGCTLYELDYYRESNISYFQVQDNAKLCYLLGNLTSDIIDPLWPTFSTHWLENQTYSTDIGLVSGKNALQKLTNTSNLSKYSIDGCSLNSVYKYVCADSSANIYPWYSGWKDVAEIKAHTVTRLRIRWAKNSYNASESVYPYFSYGEDELLEFPGFVYHCHILPHQENMMMRPIMLQPSDAYLALIANTSGGQCTMDPDWLNNEKCINLALSC